VLTESTKSSSSCQTSVSSSSTQCWGSWRCLFQLGNSTSTSSASSSRATTPANTACSSPAESRPLSREQSVPPQSPATRQGEDSQPEASKCRASTPLRSGPSRRGDTFYVPMPAAHVRATRRTFPCCKRAKPETYNAGDKQRESRCALSAMLRLTLNPRRVVPCA
jgi:hypothetical protein